MAIMYPIKDIQPTINNEEIINNIPANIIKNLLLLYTDNNINTIPNNKINAITILSPVVDAHDPISILFLFL